jgi:hypothetical protein
VIKLAFCLYTVLISAINITIIVDGTVKQWDRRKGGERGLLMSLDYQQDHTCIPSISTTFKRSSSSNTLKSSLNVNQMLKTKSFLHTNSMTNNLAKAHSSNVMNVTYSKCGTFIITSGIIIKIQRIDDFDMIVSCKEMIIVFGCGDPAMVYSLPFIMSFNTLQKYRTRLQ